MKLFGIFSTGLVLSGLTVSGVLADLEGANDVLAVAPPAPTTTCTEKPHAAVTHTDTTVIKTLSTTVSTSVAAAVATSAAAQCPDPAPKDTFTNGGFECGALGWRFLADSIQNTTISLPVDKDGAHEGSRYFQLVQHGDVDGLPIEHAQARQNLRLDPSKQYQLTFWTQQNTAADYIAATSNGVFIKTAWAHDGGDWTKNEANFSSPIMGVAYLQFTFTVKQKGAIQRLDGVELKEIGS